MKTNILGCKLGRTASKTSVQWADEGRIDCYFRVFGLRSEQDQSEDRHAAHQAQPSMGARRRKTSDDDHTAPVDPWVPYWLPVLGNKARNGTLMQEIQKSVPGFSACTRSRDVFSHI